MSGEAIDEVILAAVGLVGDYYDVAATREHRVPVALLLWEEFLNRSEHHAATSYAKMFPQVRPTLGLDRLLSQQVAAAGERAKELVVEVVAVGKDNDRRVCHLWVEDHPARVEDHGEALARSLRVPDYSSASVSRGASWAPPCFVPTGFLLEFNGRSHSRCPQRFFHGQVHRVELMIPRHLLCQNSAAQVLEHDEVSYKIEETTFVEYPFQDHLKLDEFRPRDLAPRDRSPGLEPFAPSAQRPDTRLNPVGDDKRRVIGEV